MQLSESKKEVIKSSATLMAMVIGAGILGIPYVVAKVGIVFGLLSILGIGLIMLFVNLLLGKVSLKTWGNHQLTGYAEQHLGKKGKFVMFLAMVIGEYSAIIAYLIGVSTILAELIGGDKLFYGIILISIMFVVLSYGVRIFENLESFLVLGMIILVFLLPLFLNGKVSFANLEQMKFSWNMFFIPYGAILFSYLGTQAIPIMKLQMKDNKNLNKAIIIGSLVPILIYSFFTLVILMVLKLHHFEMFKEKIATVVLEGVIGGTAPFVLNMFALLTMLSSFIAVSFALHQMYIKDYNLKKELSTFFTIFVPLIIFILYTTSNITSFVNTLEMGGVFSGGLITILVILMSWSIEKTIARRKRKTKHKFWYWVKTIFSWLVILLVSTGIFLELKSFFV